jgi:hypothetical protein
VPTVYQVNVSKSPPHSFAYSRHGTFLGPRDLSYISVYSAFPATLYRFQIYHESKLYDKKLEQDDWEWEDGVKVSNDGLVHPKINLDGMLFLYTLGIITYLERPVTCDNAIVVAKRLKPLRPLSI